ncbi:hypothetical protein BDW66DRAFT_169185 [Aspergillus desertorum]
MATQQSEPSAEFLADPGPDGRGYDVVTGMETLFLGLGLCVRHHLKRIFGWDDLIAGVAIVSALSATPQSCRAAADIRLGRHIQYISRSPQNLMRGTIQQHQSDVAILACALDKTSFAVLLLRILIDQVDGLASLVIIIKMNIVNLLAARFVFINCKDPRANWDPSITSKCWPDDFLLALLPWTIVWDLQKKKKEKMGIAFANEFWYFVQDSLTNIASTTSQENNNMLPPQPSYEYKRGIRSDTSLCATQGDRDRGATYTRDNSSQTMNLPVAGPMPSAVDNKKQISMTTEVSMSYVSNAIA